MMSTLPQANNSELKFIGWFGSCDSEPCQDLLLRDIQDSSGANASHRIAIVLQISGEGLSANKTFSTYSPDNSDPDSGIPGSNNFNKLECGHVYYIKLKKGSATGNDTQQVVLPGFIPADSATTEERLLTDVCGEPPPPCPLTLNHLNFAGWGNRPAKHTAGNSFNWCLGTPYDDPGVKNLLDCDGATILVTDKNDPNYDTYVTTKYYVHGFWPANGYEPPSDGNGNPLTEITDPNIIAKLGTADSPYYNAATPHGWHESFHVIYTYSKDSTNKVHDARTIEVVGDAYENPTCGHKITHTGATLPATLVSGQDFVLTGTGEEVSITNVDVSGSLWVAEGGGGDSTQNAQVNEIDFKVNGSVAFTLQTTGRFANGSVDFSPDNSNVCYRGTMNETAYTSGECVMQEKVWDFDPCPTPTPSPTPSPTSQLPVITLIGDASIVIMEGDPSWGGQYTDQGATAWDPQDGDISSDVVLGGDPVNINMVGTYVLTYDVTDSDGNAAVQVTRTVHVYDCSNLICVSGLTTPGANGEYCKTGNNNWTQRDSSAGPHALSVSQYGITQRKWKITDINNSEVWNSGMTNSSTPVGTWGHVTIALGGCPTECCDASLNTVNVVAEQVSELGSPRVVASGFSYSGELCCGNGSVGTPNSINLYVNGYTPSVGVVSFAGQLDSNEIYLKVTADPLSANGVPVMTGECLKGIVNGDECILEIQ